MVLSDATNHDGVVVYPPSEITAQTLIIQNDLSNNNCQGLSYLPPPHLPQFSCYQPPPAVPPFHSSAILESNSTCNDDTTINHSFFLPCQCSHLLIFHIIIPCPSSPLSSHCQFWNLSTHQHQVPPRMNPILLPCKFSLLLLIHIIPCMFSLLRFFQSNVLLPSSPLLCLKR